MRGAELLETCKTWCVVSAQVQLDCNPASSGKQLAYPPSRAGARLGRRHPQRKAMVEPGLEIGARQSIRALVCRETRTGDQRTDFCISSLGRREQHEVQIVGCAEL